MKITVKDNQTIYDIALQYAGSLEAAIDILEANGKADTLLYKGEELEIPNVISNKVVNFFSENKYVISTSETPLEVDNFVPPPGLDRTVNIFINGNSYTSVQSPEDVDIPLVDSNDDPVAYTLDGDNVKIPSLPLGQDLSILIPYSSGDDQSEITIVANSDGDITSTDTTGLSNVTISKNASSVSTPFSVSVGDLITIDYDAAGSDGAILLIGNYV